MNKTTYGTIFLPTFSAVELWCNELTHQFSDGMWKDSLPHGHSEFWCGLDVHHDPAGKARVETPCPNKCVKVDYNIAALYPDTLDRMTSLGRFGAAMQQYSTVDRGILTVMHAQGMTISELIDSLKAGLAGLPKLPSNPRFVNRDFTDLCVLYHATKYSMKHLQSDVALIKRAMKTVRT